MKNTEPKKKGKGKKRSRSKPAPLALDITETAMYESLDVDNPVDYTYPKASPTSNVNPEATSAYYTYITTRREGEESSSKGEEEDLYHAIGPDSVGMKRMIEAAPPPVPERNNTGTDTSSFYRMLEGAVGDFSAHYEDPTKPKFQVSQPVTATLCYVYT